MALDDFRAGLRRGGSVTKFCFLLISALTISVVVKFTRLPRTWLPYGSMLHAHGAFAPDESHLPQVIVYRRTKKTASSSMLEELLKVTTQHGYVSLYHSGPRMKEVVRAEYLAPNPRRLFVAEHNAVTRDETAGRKTLIIDTIMDGYRQVTSYCRYVKKVRMRHCDEQLIKCLEGPALSQSNYRWAGKSHEDISTFIDMPLSSEHPALSTTAFQRVFENSVLDVKKRNSVGSACPEDPKIRAVYNKWYKRLDRQINKLRIRLLALAGYPANSKDGNVSITEMMDKAEELERRRYLEDLDYVFGEHEATREVSEEHIDLKRGELTWGRLPTGETT